MPGAAGAYKAHLVLISQCVLRTRPVSGVFGHMVSGLWTIFTLLPSPGALMMAWVLMGGIRAEPALAGDSRLVTGER